MKLNAVKSNWLRPVKLHQLIREWMKLPWLISGSWITVFSWKWLFIPQQSNKSAVISSLSNYVSTRFSENAEVFLYIYSYSKPSFLILTAFVVNSSTDRRPLSGWPLLSRYSACQQLKMFFKLFLINVASLNVGQSTKSKANRHWLPSPCETLLLLLDSFRSHRLFYCVSSRISCSVWHIRRSLRTSQRPPNVFPAIQLT